MTKPEVASRSDHKNSGRLATTLFFYAIYTAVLCALFLHALATKPLLQDEVFTFLQVADKNFSTFMTSFESGANFLPYSYFVGLWGVDQASALTPLSLRLPSLIFAILAVFVFHSVLRSYFGGVIAFVACVSSLLIAPVFLTYSHEARPYSLYVLMAAITLYTCTSMLREHDLRPALLNTLAAFGLPSAHFVGLFYSVSAALALGLVKYRTNPSHFQPRAMLSFVIGWALFGATHLAQIVQLRSGATASDPSWIPVPTLQSIIESLFGGLQLPPLVVLALLLLMGVSILRRNPRPTYRNEAADPAISFLFLTSLFWLLLPVAFAILAIAGLPNLSLPRYFLPSVLGAGAIIGLLLYLFERAYAPGPAFRKSVSVAVVLLSVAFMVIVHRVPILGAMAQPGHVANFPSASSELPIVANNHHVYFPYLFYNSFGKERGKLLLMRRTNEEIENWKKLNPQIHGIDVGSLPRLKDFRYLYKKCPSTSKSCQPKFDIVAWAEKNGYRINREGAWPGVTVYRLSKR